MRLKKIEITFPLIILLFLVTLVLLIQFGMLLDRSRNHNSDEIELMNLSNNVLHDNNYLIKIMKTYILTREDKYLDEYMEMLNDYDSFYGRMEKMIEIGVTKEESDIILEIMQIWGRLEKIENSALEALDAGTYEEAISIVYGEEYADTDIQLAGLIQELIKRIEARGREITFKMNRQIQIVMVLFSIAFLVIVSILSYIFNKNSKLKDLYKKQKEDIELTSQYKSVFLATMSHEIRTPMNAILGITEIQLQNENNPPETEDALAKIYDSGNLLLHIINDILDLSKIEAGKLEIIPVKYDIPSLINDTVVLNKLRFESKPINFSLKLDENTPHDLFGDELRIRQVLNNILSNAFKYTDKGEVSMTVYPEYDNENDDNSQETKKVTIVFRISDTGQGMTEEEVNRLFDEYSRFNMEANRTTMGTGLGMSIARKLVYLMDGEILVESEKGIGSVFTIKIPQKSVGKAVCGPVVTSSLEKFNFKSTLLTKKTQMIREYMPYGSVLVVDDVESNIFVAKGMLAPYGLKIDTVTSGFEAIDKVKSGNVYDIIFMDHMMPKMDGIEATRIIRNMGYTKYIVALTANAIAGQTGIFLENGFDAYISKPIDSRELNFILNELIRDHQTSEVIEAARKEQKIKEMDKTISISEIKRYFLIDVEKAIGILRYINEKLHDSDSPVLDEEDLQSYIIAVHGLKTALANIGESKLSAVALTLEKAGHEKDFPLLKDNISDYINQLYTLTGKYRLDVNDEHEEITAEDFNLLKEKMEEIKNACGSMNKKDAKNALKDLRNKSWPSQIRLFLDDISLFLLHSDFDKAQAMAENTVKYAHESAAD